MYIYESERIAQAAQADKDRTALQFVNFLGGVMGNDQSMAGHDNGAQNLPGQYQTVTPFGVAVEGRPISDQQRNGPLGSGSNLMLLLLVVGVAVMVVH